MQIYTKGKANLDVFSETLMSLAEKDKDIVVVTGDSRGSAKLVPFAEKYPQQLVEIGIAEQNLVGVAAGLAACGKKVFAVSPACFLTARALEQIKNDVSYSDYPVKLVGISAGVSYGALGSTHHSLHDFAVLQAIDNLDIVVPADNFETRAALEAAVNYPRPLYLRFGKKPMVHLHRSEPKFQIGKALLLREGKDISFLAIGETVAQALIAAEQLEEEGVHASVVSVHTLKPLDTETILNIAKQSKGIITVEEHSVFGGLGSTVAALLMQEKVFVPLKIVGMIDEFHVSGSQEEIFAHYGITPTGLAEKAKELLSA